MYSDCSEKIRDDMSFCPSPAQYYSCVFAAQLYVVPSDYCCALLFNWIYSRDIKLMV